MGLSGSKREMLAQTKIPILADDRQRTFWGFLGFCSQGSGHYGPADS